MALRDLPYIPFYVQDFLTDEKLAICSAEATGVYIRLICIMHKSERYGAIKLKAKFKQNKSTVNDFAVMLRRFMPYDTSVIESSLDELIENDVVQIVGEELSQKRMMKDGSVSEARATAGSKGGKVGRNSGTKRYYNEPGFLYLIYDKDDLEAFKVGISKEPEKRLTGIIRKSGRNNLKIKKCWSVSDMGEAEQCVLDFYNDIRDGEWLFGSYNINEIEASICKVIKQYIQQNESKTKANSEYEIEYENEIRDVDTGGAGEKEEGVFQANGVLPTMADSGQMILSRLEVGSTIEFVRITLKRDLTEKEVFEYFEAFKIQNFTGKKYYEDVGDIITHFRNWIKTNPLIKQNGNSKHRSKAERSVDTASELVEEVLGRNPGLGSRESYPGS